MVRSNPDNGHVLTMHIILRNGERMLFETTLEQHIGEQNGKAYTRKMD